MPKSFAKKNKEIRQEALREELKAREYLRQLQDIDETLKKNYKDITPAEVSALRLRADINFKRLDKVLPNLSSVEMTADITVNNERELSEAELLNIAASGSTGDSEQKGSESKSSSVH